MNHDDLSRARLALVGLLLAPSLALAQDRGGDRPNRPERPATPAQQHPEVLKAYVADQLRRSEQELADLIQRRSATRAVEMPYLNLQIDLRILARWLAQQLLEADPFSDGQAVAWLRLRDLQTATATVDAWAPQQLGREPAKPQADAMKTITKATYDLPAGADVPTIDGVLVPLRAPLLIALGDATGEAPNMRPPAPEKAPATRPAEQPAIAAAPPAAPAAPLTLDQINGRVTQLPLSPGLRQQLLGALSAARQAPADDSAAMADMLRSALETAESLQNNLSVDATARAEIEQKLGQAVALFSDPRLRDVAQKHFDELKQYRELSARMAAMALPRQTMQSLGPVFAYARANPKDAPKLLKAIDRFAALEQEIAQVKVPPMNVLGARQLDAQLKAYATAREAFLAECENIVNAGTGGAFAADVGAVPTRAEDLERQADLLRLLARLPQAQERLLSLKPRPTGGLEKRLLQTLVRLGDNDATERANAQTLLRQVDDIASAWADAQEATANPIDPEAFKALAGTAWPEIEANLKATATELTTAIAGGASPDAAKLKTLHQAKALLADVRRIVDLRTRLVLATALARWADCTLTQPKIDALLEMHRSDYGPVVAAVLAGNGDEKELRRQETRYRGLLATLGRAADRAEACAALPADARGLVGRLTTPSDKTPFQAIRFLSFASDLLDFARAAPEVDQAAVMQLQDQMLSTLNRLSR